MVYKWGLGYFSYFCNANHIQRGNAAHKKSVTTRSKGILAPDRALWRIFVLVCDWRPTNRPGAFISPVKIKCQQSPVTASRTLSPVVGCPRCVPWHKSTATSRHIYAK